jgi:hypothetical protein
VTPERSRKAQALYDKGLGTYSRIADRLVAGGMPGRDGDGRGVSWAELDALEVSVLFSLLPVDFSSRPTWLKQEVHPLVDAVDDRSGADLRYLERTVRKLTGLLAADETVYVHCMAGVSRTGLVLCAWRMQAAREPPEQALAWLRERRRCLEPNRGFQALLADWGAFIGV